VRAHHLAACRNVPLASPEPAPRAVVLPGGAPGGDQVLPAGYHRWPGEVLEQSACDDPGMGKIMACAGLLCPCDHKGSPRGLRQATATGAQEPVERGRTAQISPTSRSPA
jgi:hypothetical protein